MRRLIIIAFVLPILFSCNKENNEIEPSEVLTYFPLEIGNYWIYQHYKIDTLGNETILEAIDSITITKDTLIRGDNFFIFEGHSDMGFCDLDGSVLRDSSGYLVDSAGNIFFAESNFTDTLLTYAAFIDGDTVYTIDYKMEQHDIDVITPAGSFEVLNYRGTLIMHEEVEDLPSTRYMNNFYSKDVGKIVSTYLFMSVPYTYERRLVRYHIQEE
jgi:hypothetical protein